MDLVKTHTYIQSLGIADISLTMDNAKHGKWQPKLKYLRGSACPTDPKIQLSSEIEFYCDANAGKVSLVFGLIFASLKLSYKQEPKRMQQFPIEISNRKPFRFSSNETKIMILLLYRRCACAMNEKCLMFIFHFDRNTKHIFHFQFLVLVLCAVCLL